MKTRTIEEWMRDKERDDNPEGRRRRALIPEPWRNKTWADLDDSARAEVPGVEKQVSVRKVLMTYADDWEAAREEGDGLVLLGPPGYGKSLGAALVAMDVIDQGGWVRFTSFGDLVQRETELFRLAKEAERTDDWGDHEKEELKLRWLKWEVDLLVLDDVGKERRTQSDFGGDLLERLVRKRFSDGMPTIITSNLSMDLWGKYNASMESFMYDLGEVVEYVDGRDHRGTAPSPVRGSRRARW